MEVSSPLQNPTSDMAALAKDLSAVSCKDDSKQGKQLMDGGAGRKAALVHWRLAFGLDG